MKIIYHYSSGTGAFLHADEARESPLEPGVFAIPAHATDLAPPPAGAGQVAVFRGGTWFLLSDAQAELVNIKQRKIEEIAEACDHAIVVAVSRRAALIADVKAAGVAATVNGIEWGQS